MSIIINFFKQNFFIFEIFLSYIPYIFLLKPGKSCWKKLLACIVGCVLFSLVLPAIRTGNEVFNNIIVMLSFLALVAVTVVALKLCFKDSWLALILCGISAYATQHIFFRIRTLTLIILKRIDWLSEGLFFFLYCIEFACLLIGLYFLLVHKFKKQVEFKVNNEKVVALTLALIVIAIILSDISVMEMFSMGWGALIAFNAYVVIACLFLLLNLFNNVNNKAMEEEMAIIKNLWLQDTRQYEISKQNIELLNIKFHDLKHYINNNILDKTSVQEISRCLDIYDSTFRTGNKPLDVVLTEKKLICDSKGIKFFCMADGALLNEMAVGDIYSLFGNAIDNAIECLVNSQDEDKKYIRVIVKRINKMVRIQFENYNPNEVKIINGFPKTTKRDKENHGYGLKSIYYIVEKYKGAMDIDASSEDFRLSILLPILN